MPTGDLQLPPRGVGADLHRYQSMTPEEDTRVATRLRFSARAVMRRLVLVIGVAVAYYLGAQLGLAVALVREQVTPLWPSTGIALACLLVFGLRVWPGILIGALAVNATLGPSMIAVVGIAVGNCAAPVIAAIALTRAGFQRELQRVRDVLALVLLGALSGMLISATIGTAALVTTRAAPVNAFWSTWSVWWAGDAMGVLVVTPVLLAFRTVWGRARRKIRTAARLEATAVLVGVAVLSAAVTQGHSPALFALYPALLWSAWRFGLTVVAPCALIASVATTVAATAGQPPFTGLTVLHQMLLLQAINGSMALTALLLAAAAGERKQALLATERAGAELETRVRDRTATLASAIARLERSESLLTEAQQVGQVGCWERDLTTGALIWTDELFRLYGLPPQSVKMDYETFLSRVHPDDRAAVRESNAQAVLERRPVEMDHRIRWPDGSVRWLHRRGRVVLDESGNPVKMVGTAQDVTAGKKAEDTLRRSEEHTRTLLDSVTDAVVGIDATGRISLVNHQTEELFGYAEHELTGKPVEMLLPERLRESHRRHRTQYLTAPQARPMGVGLELFSLRKDGSEFPADIALRPLPQTPASDGPTLVVAAIRDITERRQAEQANRQLQETRRRRRQALEINDNVVQGLAASIYALDRGNLASAIRTMRSTLGAARQMMRELLDDNADIEPGDLVREAPATLTGTSNHEVSRPAPAPITEAHVSLVIADDSRELRLALRALLETLPAIDIVGEATNGAEAVQVAAGHQPDAMLLDLAMPVMDGLEALPRIHSASPGTKVIVMSGYGRDHIGKQALQNGAAAFLEKGGSSQLLISLLQDLFPGLDSPQSTPRDPGDERARSPATDDATSHTQTELVSTFVHELRNPITALGAITHLLIERHDQMPSASTRELLNSLARNLHQVDRLLRAFADVARMGAGELELLLQPTDVGALIRAVLSDLQELTKDHLITVELPGTVTAGIDPFRIRQVLTNLLSNAVKFSNPSSPITITVTTPTTGIDIAVTDHGTGIPAEDRERVFGKFERLGSQRPGIGLGLYISREIARAHGGDIIITDTGPGETTFLMTLPDLLASH